MSETIDTNARELISDCIEFTPKNPQDVQVLFDSVRTRLQLLAVTYFGFGLLLGVVVGCLGGALWSLP